MSKKILAVVGSYRKGGMTDSVVDAVLDAARERGAEVSKMYLLDKHLEFCKNCRACMQTPGGQRGECPIQDDLQSILSEIDAADAIVLGAPVNVFNVTAIFRQFMERLVGCAYWPWGKPSPEVRDKRKRKQAVLVTSAAMPGLLIPFGTGAPRALKAAADMLGARVIAKIWVGIAAKEQHQRLSVQTEQKARNIGASLA